MSEVELLEGALTAGLDEDSVFVSLLDSDFDSAFDPAFASDFASAFASLLEESDFDDSEAGVLTPFDFA